MNDRKKVRILVTGSRTWINIEKIADALDLVKREFPNQRDWIIVHGDCPEGADQIVDAWAKVRGIDREPHPADWRRFGRKAGPHRNEEMVKLGADVCLAFLSPCVNRNCREGHPHASHGTMHCATEARKAGIPTWTIRDQWPT